jgi:hypothetical protein
MALDEVEKKVHTFLASVVDGGKWSTSRCSRWALREDSTIPVGRLAVSTASLDMVAKIKHPAGNTTSAYDPLFY